MQLFYVFRKASRRARRALGGNLAFRIYGLGAILLILFLLHVLAMVIFEGFSTGEAAWLTITTATTVGYGDISAVTAVGRWSTVLFMYVGGIFVLAQLAGLVFEAAQARLERQRLGKVKVDTADHIVIFGWRETYLRRVIQEIRASRTDLREEEIIIVSPNLNTLPEDFVANNVFHVNGPYYEKSTLLNANVAQAARIAILPEAGTEETAYANLELISRLKELAPAVPIIFAAQNSTGETMADDLGVSDALLFDPNYPDIFSRAILTVGAEGVVEEIISRSGVEMVIIHQPLNCKVADVIAATADNVTLLGIRNIETGQYDLHPQRSREVRDERLIFLLNTNEFGSVEAAEAAITASLQHLIEDRELIPFDDPDSVGVVGSTKRASERYIQRLEKELDNVKVVYLGAGVVSAGGAWKEKELHDLDALVLLANDPSDPATDAKNYLLIRQLRERSGYQGRIIAEAVLPESKTRFEKIGANDVLRPVVRNVEIMARCIMTGAEEILDNLYGSLGGDEIIALPVTVTTDWKTFSADIYDAGLPLAFERGGKQWVVPKPDFEAGSGTVYLLVDTEKWTDIRKIRTQIGSYLRS